MMNINKRRAAMGFVLTELLLGIAVIAVVALIGVGVYRGLRSGINADDMGDKTIALVSEIQKNWRTAGSYTTVSAVEVDKLSLINAPMRMNGSNLQDAYGNAMSLNGGQASFALTIGGSTAPIAKDDCATIANKIAGIASVVRIGAAATVGSGGTAGTVTGGNVFKSGATVTQSSLTDGCNEANTVIAAQFR
jgi:hypothetical protein